MFYWAVEDRYYELTNFKMEVTRMGTHHYKSGRQKGLQFYNKNSMKKSKKPVEQ